VSRHRHRQGVGPVRLLSSRHDAIRSSKEAFGVWRDTQPYERRKILLKVSPQLSGTKGGLCADPVQVLGLLQERFDTFRSALLADVSMSEIAIGQDRKSVLGLVDGAAQT
jgi:benzaldehyde dehydrogenase (NAD)